MAHILSDDLLYAIFLHSLPSTFLFTKTGLSSKVWADPPPPPFSFSLVCRSWRNVVLSRPKLWSDMNIVSTFKATEEHHNSAIERIIKQWLTNSREAPLQIHLNIQGDRLGHTANLLLPLLLNEAHRWRAFGMYIVVSVPLDPEMFTLQCLPPLTSLSLDIWSSSFPLGRVDLSGFISNTDSNLEYLSMGLSTSVILPPNRHALRLPNLRSLHYRIKNGTGDLVCILFACPNLEELEIKILERTLTTTNLMPNSIHLPRLLSLTMEISSRLSANYLLGTLSCPSLRAFSFFCDRPIQSQLFGECASIEPRRIRNFLTRSCANPPLEKLNLGMYNPNPEFAVASDLPEALEDLFFSLKSLKSLELQGLLVTREIVGALTIPDGVSLQSQPCLSLDNLRLTTFFYGDVTEDMLEELIVSRWRAGSLGAITFSFPGFGGLHKRARILDCSNEGLKVVNVSDRFR
ncbi:hypothetical protein SCHPADRAFT_911073 [Schizopora paradoxa]|uniref:F-box domain-containing protein n=1 Tax=Schizopora paradoxa TaxID=27342 RepID=A0A0H2R221_9AGAM|nr:hypothetical protein SCHPADRAFT_911073 [Schizopora paradoxa]